MVSAEEPINGVVHLLGKEGSGIYGSGAVALAVAGTLGLADLPPACDSVGAV
jgi:hypothetical protein